MTSLDAQWMWYVRDIDYGVNWVSSISEDESGTLWVTTYGGSIISFDGDVPAVVDVRHGVPEEALHTALDDRQGNLWISSNNGIYRIRKSDHRAVASGALSVLPYSVFVACDGMASDECNGGFQSSGVRSRDGKLWFPT